jgi:hypothetical protein
MGEGGGIPPDSRWMTYEEAGQRLGRLPDSVRRQAQRLSWPRQAGNDGRARVAIPGELLSKGAPVAGDASGGGDNAPTKPNASVGDKSPDVSGPMRDVLAASIERVEARLEAMQVELAAERARAAEARERATRAEGELEGLKLGIEHQHAELAQMRREVAEAHNRAVVAEQQVIEATRQREGAEVALAKARKWNFLNFLFNLEGKRRR